jgi:hypothetical protein
VTLFRSSTGENFNGLMHNLSVQAPYCVPEGPDANCGDSVAASLFFVVFFSLTDFLMIKLLIAVILDAFLTSGDGDDVPGNASGSHYRLTEADVKAYAKLWGGYDPGNSGYIDYPSMCALVCRLDYPLGLGNSPHLTLDVTTDTAAMNRRADKLLSRLPVVPTAAGKFNYHAMLHALTCHASGGRALGAAQGVVRLTGDVTTLGYTLQEVRAAVLMQATWRAAQARKRVRMRLGRAPGRGLPAGGSTHSMSTSRSGGQSAEVSRRHLPVAAAGAAAAIASGSSTGSGAPATAAGTGIAVPPDAVGVPVPSAAAPPLPPPPPPPPPPRAV